MHLKVEDIYELLNGSSERKGILMEHIKDCPKCRESFEIREKFVNSIRKIEKLSTPSDFSSQTLFEIEKRTSLLKKISIALTSIPIFISSLLLILVSISGFREEELLLLANQYVTLSLKLFKLLIKVAMGVNKLISSSFEILQKFSSASSSLAVPIFAIFLLFIFSTILFFILLNHFPLRGMRDENS